MKTTWKAQALAPLLTPIRAAYEAEIARLADEYRPRILAGEFMGHEDERGGVQNGDPRVMRLEWELRDSHPWCREGSPEGWVVMAVSPWREESARLTKKHGIDYEPDCAEQCMREDIMALAVRRGWVQRYHHPYDPHPYKPRVAA